MLLSSKWLRSVQVGFSRQSNFFYFYGAITLFLNLFDKNKNFYKKREYENTPHKQIFILGELAFFLPIVDNRQRSDLISTLDEKNKYIEWNKILRSNRN